MFEKLEKSESRLKSEVRTLKTARAKEALCRHIDAQIVNINQELSSHFEEIEAITDIVDNSDIKSDLRHYSIPDAIKMKADDLRFKRDTLQKIISAYCSDKGGYLSTIGKPNEAFDEWEKILKNDPANPFVDFQLKKMLSAKDNGYKIDHREYKTRYLFDYIGSFAAAQVDEPVYMCASEPQQLLFVSDYGGNKIHKYTVAGRYHGEIPVQVKHPIGIFLERENKLWICDFGNRRILCTDFNGNVIEEIKADQIGNRGVDSLSPAFGCIEGTHIYLTLLNKTQKSRMVISFDKKKPISSFEKYACNFSSVLEVQSYKNQLILANRFPARLLALNQIKKKLVQFTDLQLSWDIKRFCTIDNDFFYITNTQIIKLNATGELIFCTDIDKTIQGPSLLTSITGVKNKKQRTLFITDYKQRSIHMFSV